MNDFDVLIVLGECRKHYRNAQDLYAACYPDRQQKSHMVIKRLADLTVSVASVQSNKHVSNVDQLQIKIMCVLS